jgi:hypothetical protein
VSGLQSSITQNADAIGLVVEKKNGQNVINSASILTSINQDTSQIKISADKIILDGNTVAASLSGKEVYANAFGGDDLYVYSALHIEEDGDLYYGYGSSAHRYNFSDVIVGASVSGNVLTLTKADGNPVTFSKATSLSGAWSGRTFTVTAKQNNVQVNTCSGFVYDGIVPSGSTTLNGTSVEHDYIVYSDDGEGNADKQILKKKISIGCSNYLVAKTGNDKITANGTYTPGSGKLGFSSVEVNVPSSGGTVTLEWDAYGAGEGKQNTIRAMQNGQEVASKTIYLNVSNMSSGRSVSKVCDGSFSGETLCEDDVKIGSWTVNLNDANRPIDNPDYTLTHNKLYSYVNIRVTVAGVQKAIVIEC